MKTTNHMIDVILMEREHGHWVAQCLQYDLGAQGESLADLEYQLERVMNGYAAICLENGVEPFSDLDSAPPEYWDLWRKATMEVSPSQPAPKYRLPSLTSLPTPRMRVTAA